MISTARTRASEAPWKSPSRWLHRSQTHPGLGELWIELNCPPVRPKSVVELVHHDVGISEIEESRRIILIRLQSLEVKGECN